jgi:hypothetical protein
VLPIVTRLASLALPRDEGSLIMAIILFVAGHNLTESSLSERDVITQVYLMSALAPLARRPTPRASIEPARPAAT